MDRLPQRSFEVCRDPEGRLYRSRGIVKPGASITPLAFPDVSLPVALILGE